MKTLTHKFVEFIPEDLDQSTLYISTNYSTVVHMCCCGCGSEVITPLSPSDWKLIFDGETVSLYPSIGNWNLRCKSHYWIANDQVIWADRWTKRAIEHLRYLAARPNNSTATKKRVVSTLKSVFRRRPG